MLEYADQSGVVEVGAVIGFVLHQSGERLAEPLVLEDHAAGHEVAALGWLILAQSEQHLAARVANDQINGYQWRETDDRVQLGMAEKTRHSRFDLNQRGADVQKAPAFGEPRLCRRR